jgi:hypothetical protein
MYIVYIILKSRPVYLNGGHVLSDGLDDGRGLVAEDAGKKALGVVAVQRVDVGVAQGVGDHLDSYLACGGIILGKIGF